MGAIRGNSRRVFVAALCMAVFGCALVVSGQVRTPVALAVPRSSHAVSVAPDGRIATGDKHTCMIRDDGTVWCWGANEFTQLGNSVDMSNSETAPVQVDAFPNFQRPVRITAGRAHTCALLANGSVSCWGDDSFSQLGDGGSSQLVGPITVDLGSGKTAVTIAAGGYETCALLNDSSVKCWGKNNYGQVGNNTSGLAPVSAPATVTGIPSNFTVRSLEVGNAHVCAVSDIGAVWCWGYNSAGQLGNPAPTNSKVPASTQSLGSGLTAVQVSAGDLHTCAVLGNGKVSCWGSNSADQLGNTGASTGTPATVTLSGDAVKVSSGSAHTCALIADGTVWCWGANTNGELGQGATGANTATPQQVSLASRAVDVSVGSSHTCALLDTGVAQCWGLNDRGQLGVGDMVNKSSATAVAFTGGAPTSSSLTSSNVGDNTATLTASIGVNDGSPTYRIEYGTTPGLTGNNTVVSLGGWGRVEQVATGDFSSCVLTVGGAVQCWGSNSNGELGNSAYQASSTPVPVTNMASGVRRIAVGLHHSCAVLTTGAVQCWGLGTSGQLGNGANNTSTTPVTVNLGANEKAVDVVAGDDATCAQLSNGGVKCWGAGSGGQLGNAASNQSSSPVNVNLAASDVAIAVAMRGQHACAVLSSGGAKCWGTNSIGDGVHSSSNTPLAVSLGSGVARSIALGTSHACVSLTDGTVRCWGANTHGQLGDGGNSAHSTPTSTSSLGVGSFVDKVISAGDDSCALLAGGTEKCWGAGSSGQLGLGPTDVNDHTSPTSLTLANSENAVALDLSSEHACALSSVGYVQCWGSSTNGERGVGASQIVPPIALDSFANRQVSTQLTGLNSGTTYYARVVSRWLGTDDPSSIISFSTSSPTTTTASTTTSSSSSSSSSSSVVATTVAPTTTALTSTTQPETSTSVASVAVTSTTVYVRPLIIDIRLKLRRSASAATIANAVSFVIPKKSKGSMRITISSGRNICSFVGTSVRGVRKGTCRVTVLLIPLHGKPTSRTTRIIVS